MTNNDPSSRNANGLIPPFHVADQNGVEAFLKSNYVPSTFNVMLLKSIRFFKIAFAQSSFYKN